MPHSNSEATLPGRTTAFATACHPILTAIESYSSGTTLRATRKFGRAENNPFFLYFISHIHKLSSYQIRRCFDEGYRQYDHFPAMQPMLADCHQPLPADGAVGGTLLLYKPEQFWYEFLCQSKTGGALFNLIIIHVFNYLGRNCAEVKIVPG